MSFLKRFNYRFYRRTADEWINSKEGIRFRFGVLGATVGIPTLWMLMLDGPLLNLTFKWRERGIDYELPESLRRVVDKEYERWLTSANKSTSESSAQFSCQPDASSSLDSITKGSLSVRFGAQVALPFYARFRDEAEALDYCKKKLEPFNFLGKTLCVLWESQAGKELISTLVLSDKALSFLAARDLLAVEPSPSLTNKPTVWATWTTFSSMAAYFLNRKVFNQTALSFVLCYMTTLALTTFGSMEWHKSYVYLTDSHADSSASRLSSDHSEGGREFYVKFFKRNRILRSLMDSKEAERLFTEAGDVRSATTPYLLRYDLVKDVVIEEQELGASRRGDD